MIRLALMFVVLAGCAPVPLAPTVPIHRQVERAELPPDPAQEPLPTGVPAGEWVEPLEAGSCTRAAPSQAPCPSHSGILVSEARAVRDAYFRLRYPELRLRYESDRRVWTAHRELYDAELVVRDEAIRRLQPDWFQRNAFALGLGAGATIVGLVVALVAVGFQ